ncbi:MAG: ATP-binding cassette domain-containing protein, partial [Chromatocurvus sp.]
INAGVQRGIAASESIFAILDQPVECNSGTRTLDAPRGRIECRHLSFRFQPADAPVLQDINLVIEPGETVALVGRSGAGKSTLASLIAGFTRPPAGCIFIDDIALEDIRLESLRQHIAVVNQHTVLFEASVADNIAYGELRGASDAAIQRAADDACASEFITQLPAGMATQVNEDANDLSGGQRQRLALARAFLKDARILVLDEATSALDAHSENLIQQALARITEDRTTLIIAHRLSTVEHADRIVVLEAGRVIESGTHAGLVASNGAYADLYRQQLNDDDVAN